MREHRRMVFRIDPDVPEVWRSVDELQLGAPTPVAVISNPSAATRGMLTLLRRGASEQALIALTETLGGTAVEVRDLLNTLAPALTTPNTRPEPQPLPHLVAVDAANRADADALIRALGELGHTAAPISECERESVSCAVLIRAWVTAPAAYQPWVRRDVPHLAIVYGQLGVEVGPFVEPGDGPCLRCRDLAQRDLDPAWPAIATQLARRAAPGRTARTAHDAVAAAAALVDDRLKRGVNPLREASVSLTRPWGVDQPTPVGLHPECGCQGLAQISMPAVVPARGSSPPNSGAIAALHA